MTKLLHDRGVDRRFGRLLFGRLRSHGLASVGAEVRVFMLQGRSSGTSLLRANYEQLHDALVDAGYIAQQQFDQDVARLDDPIFMMPSGILWGAWGRQP